MDKKACAEHFEKSGGDCELKAFRQFHKVPIEAAYGILERLCRSTEGLEVIHKEIGGNYLNSKSKQLVWRRHIEAAIDNIPFPKDKRLKSPIEAGLREGYLVLTELKTPEDISHPQWGRSLITNNTDIRHVLRRHTSPSMDFGWETSLKDFPETRSKEEQTIVFLDSRDHVRSPKDADNKRRTTLNHKSKSPSQKMANRVHLVNSLYKIGVMPRCRDYLPAVECIWNQGWRIFQNRYINRYTKETGPILKNRWLKEYIWRVNYDNDPDLLLDSLVKGMIDAGKDYRKRN